MTDEVKGKFIEALISKPPELIASVWIIDRVPVPFDSDLERFAVWRSKLARGFNVDPSSLIVTGSSAFGISLNPNKNYRFFDIESDIDVAVISDYHFTEAWRALRGLRSRVHGLSPRMKQSVNDHVSRYIYWGTIATDRILQLLPFGKNWAEAIEEMQKTEPTHDRKIKARIYRDFESLRSYQVNNLRNLRSKEIEKGLNDVEVFEHN